MALASIKPPIVEGAGRTWPETRRVGRGARVDRRSSPSAVRGWRWPVVRPGRPARGRAPCVDNRSSPRRRPERLHQRPAATGLRQRGTAAAGARCLGPRPRDRRPRVRRLAGRRRGASRRKARDARGVPPRRPRADRLDRRLPRDGRARPVPPGLAPGDVRARLPAHPPADPRARTPCSPTSSDVVVPGSSHWQHPSFFAYFPRTRRTRRSSASSRQPASASRA